MGFSCTKELRHHTLRFVLPFSNVCMRGWRLFFIGAGLYNFFQNYNQTCLSTTSCQSQILNVDSESTIHIYSLSTVGTTYQLSVNGKGIIKQSDNTDGFQETATVWIPASSSHQHSERFQRRYIKGLHTGKSLRLVGWTELLYALLFKISDQNWYCLKIPLLERTKYLLGLFHCRYWPHIPLTLNVFSITLSGYSLANKLAGVKLANEE